MASNRRLERGLTIVELMTALALAAVILGMAVPSFRRLWGAVSLGSGASQMMASLHRARSAAILRNVPVVVCLSADDSTCLVSAAERASGWLVFQDVHRRLPLQLESEDELLHRVRLPQGLSIQGTRAALTYWPTVQGGGTTGTFLVCETRGGVEGRAVVVSQTGRPRQAGAAPCSS
jgi:type IV fimbrial biogenesis protein FimT